MKINIIQGHSTNVVGDINIVIDVIRAFTTSFYFFGSGVKCIYLAKDPSDSFSLKNELPNSLTAGEKDAIKIEGFDFGNSPAEASKAQNISDKVIIQKTTNGVTAVFNALECDHLFVTGLPTAKALSNFIIKKLDYKNSTINLIASHPSSDEDVACAEYIKSYLLNKPMPLADVQSRIRKASAAQKFLDPEKTEFNANDIEFCCTEYDPQFIMKVNIDDKFNRPKVTMENI